MTYNILPIFLLAGMLIIMLMGIMLPFGAKITGKKVSEIRLSFRERLLLQRINIYSIGGVLLLTAVTGLLPAFWELLVILAAMMLLFMRVRYLITNDGVALNNVVFRPWTEFTGFEVNSRGIILLPKAGLRQFKIRVLGKNRDEFVVLLKHYLPEQMAQQSKPKSFHLSKLIKVNK